jgi:hypothetical protein
VARATMAYTITVRSLAKYVLNRVNCWVAIELSCVVVLAVRRERRRAVAGRAGGRRRRGGGLDGRHVGRHGIHQPRRHGVALASAAMASLASVYFRLET